MLIVTSGISATKKKDTKDIATRYKYPNLWAFTNLQKEHPTILKWNQVNHYLCKV